MSDYLPPNLFPIKVNDSGPPPPIPWATNLHVVLNSCLCHTTLIRSSSKSYWGLHQKVWLTSWDARNPCPKLVTPFPVPQHSSLHDAGRKSRRGMVSAENPPVTSPPIHKSQPSRSELPDSGAVTSPTASAETLPFSPCALSPPLRDALPPNGHSCHSLTALTSLLKNHLPGEPFLNHQPQPNP